MGGSPSESAASNRREFLTVAGTAATVALAGCAGGESSLEETDTTGSGEDSATEGSDGDDGGGESRLSASIPEASTFDPVQIKGDGSQIVANHVFDGLFGLARGSLEPEGELVTGYERSDDRTTYRLDIKEGVQFHDGTELTADDVAYSLERLAASDNSQEQGSILDTPFVIAHESTTETVDGEEQEVYDPGTLAVEAVEEYAVEIQLEQPFFDSLFWFAYNALDPIPEGIVGDIEGYDGEMEYTEFASQAPVGTGEFAVANVNTGSEVTLDVFGEYHGEAPGYDGIDLSVVQNANTRYQRIANRDVDVFRLPTSRFDPSAVSIDETTDLGAEVGTYGELDNGETVNYQTYDEAYTAYFIINCERIERPIRRAMAYAVNQETWLDQAFKGVGSPAYHYTPPSVYPGGQEAYMEHARENYPYGVNESRMSDAQAEMEAAGYGEDSPAEVTLTVYTDRNPDAYQRIAEQMRSRLSAAYIELSIDTAPFNTIINGAINGELDMFSLGNGLEYPSPADMLQFAYPSDGNFSQWFDTDAAQRSAEAWATVQNNLGVSEADQQARNEAFIEMEEAAWEDVPVLLNYHPRGQRYWYDDVDVPTRSTGFHAREYDDVSFE